jgi:hypothetical protein
LEFQRTPTCFPVTSQQSVGIVKRHRFWLERLRIMRGMIGPKTGSKRGLK